MALSDYDLISCTKDGFVSTVLKPMDNILINAYLDKCLDIISSFDEFVIRHLPTEENGQANALAQQASGYSV